MLINKRLAKVTFDSLSKFSKKNYFFANRENNCWLERDGNILTSIDWKGMWERNVNEMKLIFHLEFLYKVSTVFPLNPESNHKQISQQNSSHIN